MAVSLAKVLAQFRVLAESGVLFSARGEPRPEELLGGAPGLSASLAAPGASDSSGAAAPLGSPDSSPLPASSAALAAPDASNSPGPARHEFSGHAPLWAFENPWLARPVADGPPVFTVLPPESSLEQVLAATRLVGVIGALPTPEFHRLLAEPGVIVLVFEHDAARLGRLLAEVDPARLPGKAFLFLGRPHEFLPPLSELLGREVFRLGFPAFLLPAAAAEADSAFAAEVCQYVETLFYRHHVYPLGGQSLSRGLPLRPIAQDLFYDQLVHAYENIPAYALCPDIDALRGLFRGETAILAAAGSALAEQYDFLRHNQDRAVIICVNSALKNLVAAGIRPHFCVVNDTSLQVSKTFAGLPVLRPVMLVAHSLSCLGGEVFPQRFLFGQVRPDIFGPRPSLRLHGSVLTTAYALARHLGCTRAVLAGALLSSADPWSLSYVSGSTGRTFEPQSRALINRFPQLCPVVNRFGRQRYTSLNFLDVKHWLGDELRQGGLEVVNTSKDSILDTPPVRFDEAPVITPTGRLPGALRQAYAARRRAPALDAALAYARAERARHQACLALLDGVEPLPDEAFLPQARKLLAIFDNNNVTYLLQRFEDFRHTQFYEWITSPDPAAQVRGLRYQFGFARRMLDSLVALLAKQEEQLLPLVAPR